MSELKKNRIEKKFRWNLLCSVSALALAATPAMAADDATDHPLLWVTLGGDLDMLSGTNAPFAPDFALQSPTPDVFKGIASPIGLQKPPRFTYGEEASIAFQPDSSDWIFSAGIKYGRSNNKRDVHRQSVTSYQIYNVLYKYHTRYPTDPPFTHPYFTKTTAKFAETTVNQSERHMVVDFQASKDVGLGMFGHDGSSVVGAGVRLARFETHSDVTMHAKPLATPYVFNVFGGLIPIPYFHFNTYYQHGQADRSFNGFGPSISWKASAPFAGNEHDGEISLDWSVNGAILFGKQRAKVSHRTVERHYTPKYEFSAPTVNNPNHTTNYQTVYDTAKAKMRSRSVTVPDLGASIGVSYRVQDFKLSLGYRADYFFGAVDEGIDTAKKKALSFNGVYASISIGLGD